MKKIICAVISLLSVFQAGFAQGTLLVANKNENSVSIISISQGTELFKLNVGQGPHEVAVSPSGKLVVVANYGNKQVLGNSLSVIDIAKKQVVKEISTGEYVRPHGIEFINEDDVLVTSEAKQVLINVNIATDVVTEVAKTNQLVSHMVAWSPADKKAYVANIASGTVSMIDVAEKILLRQLEFKKGIEGVAVSPDGKEVWAANREDSTVTAMSTVTFEVLGTMPAHQIAYRIKFLPNGKQVLVSNGLSGNVSVYDARLKKHIKDIDLTDKTFFPPAGHPNMPVPVGTAVSTDSKYVFVSCSGYDRVAVISTANWKIVKTISVGDGPDGIYYSPVEP
ncbi:MAG: beta-propeller fold lactonase family protein [Cyclobacteriaceae bacterium]|nr:beta-propeller fold lactonase family protein [Cyclobacteriaceae bacterium]